MTKPFNSPKRIIAIASEISEIPVAKIIGVNRVREYAHIRAAITVACRREWEKDGRSQHSRWTYNQIARALNRDHTSVIALFCKWEVYTKRDPWLLELLEQIEAAALLPDTFIQRAV